MEQLKQNLCNELKQSKEAYNENKFVSFCFHCRKLIEYLCQSVFYSSIEDKNDREAIFLGKKTIERGKIVDCKPARSSDGVKGKGWTYSAAFALQYQVVSVLNKIDIDTNQWEQLLHLSCYHRARLCELYDELSQIACHATVKPLTSEDLKKLVQECVDRLSEYIDFIIKEKGVKPEISESLEEWKTSINEASKSCADNYAVFPQSDIQFDFSEEDSVEEYSDNDRWKVYELEGQLADVNSRIKDCSGKLSNPYCEGLLLLKLQILQNLADSSLDRYLEYEEYGAEVLSTVILNAFQGHVKCNARQAEGIVKFIDACPSYGIFSDICKIVSWTMSGDYSKARAVYGSHISGMEFNPEKLKQLIIRRFGYPVSEIYHVCCCVYGKFLMEDGDYAQAYPFMLYAVNESEDPFCRGFAIECLKRIVDESDAKTSQEAQRALDALGVETKEEIGSESWLARLSRRLFRLLED